MQCKEFASVLEQQGLSPLSDAAQDHLARCVACQDLLADLSSIVATAKKLPAEVDPPQRIWVSLRAQLEAVGLVKEPAVVAAEESSRWLQNLRAWFTPRTFATAGVGLSLVIAAFLQFHKPQTPAISSAPAQVAKQQIPSDVAKPEVPTPAPPQQVASTVRPAQSAAPGKTRHSKPSQTRPPSDSSGTTLTPSENVQYVDTAGFGGPGNNAPNGRVVSNPELDESLRINLRTVNEFIAECEAHLKKHPNDSLAREYLQSAIQQKQELIGAILDSGRSEQ
jgi:hypothetical protein